MNSKLLQKKAQAFLEHFPFFMSVIRTPESYLFDIHQDLLKPQVLDFGCGDGMFAQIAFPHKTIDVGLDVTESRAEEAKKIPSYTKIILYDGSTIPFKDNYFSSVFSSSVLEHIPDISKSIKEIARVLKPKGYFLVTVMTDKWNDYLVGSKLIGNTYTQYMKKKQQHFNLLSQEEWTKKFVAAGFTVDKTVGYLTSANAPYLDILHYFSIPSLITYKLYKKWVILPKWYKQAKIDTWIVDMTKKGMEKPENSAALFFVLRKK